MELVKAKTMTLEELGPNLPVGFSDSSNKEIDVRNFSMKHERKLGAIRDNERNQNLARYVGAVLSNLCTKVGPHNFDELKDPERRVVISKMYMPDVYYAYIWLRIQSIGNTLKTNLVCAQCNHEFKFDADLNSTEVRIPESPEAMLWTHEMIRPLKIRGVDIKTITFGPATWAVLEPISSGELNTGEAKAALIRGSIKEIPGLDGMVALGEDELDDMSKLDLETVANSLEEHRLGPDMTLEGKCPKCDNEFKTSIDWGYDSFFSLSSR